MGRVVNKSGEVLPEPRGIDYEPLCIQLIPPGEREGYRQHALPALRQTGLLKGPDDWKSYLGSLRQMPSEHRAAYTRFSVPALARAGALSRPDDWSAHAKCYGEGMDAIPEEHRFEYACLAMPMLMDAGLLRNTGDWRYYRGSLEAIPARHRRNYVLNTMSALIRSGAVKTMEDWRNYDESRELAPLDQRENFSEHVLPALALAGKIKKTGDWKAHARGYLEGIVLVPPERRTIYTWHALPALIAAGRLKGGGDWMVHAINYSESLRLIPEEHRTEYTERALPAYAAGDAFSWEDVSEQLRIIGDYAKKFGNLFFIWKTGFDNLGKLREPETEGRHLKFGKSGSQLHVLDGQMSGIIIRTITETAYKAWEKAAEAGIPCEEILRYPRGHNKAGAYRMKRLGEGRFIVACLFGGQSLPEFFLNPENGKYALEVDKQKEDIRKAMAAKGIIHGHADDENHVVKVVDGRPEVRLIDFDEAQTTTPGAGG